MEKNYKGSIFLARGLQDWNVDPSHDFPWVTELDRKGLYVKYMLGQWQHDWPDSFSDDERLCHEISTAEDERRVVVLTKDCGSILS